MPSQDAFPHIFHRLRAILEPWAPEMVVTQDSGTSYSLDTRHTIKNGQPLFFASMSIRKNYVSLYVMPVYAFPDLLDDIGDLKTRMHGKSCFSFRQLADLVCRGYGRYAAEGVLA
jgi:hypothetical protein